MKKRSRNISPWSFNMEPVNDPTETVSLLRDSSSKLQSQIRKAKIKKFNVNFQKSRNPNFDPYRSEASKTLSSNQVKLPQPLRS